MATIVNPVEVLPLTSLDACVAPDQQMHIDVNPLVELSVIIVATLRKQWDFNLVEGTTNRYHIYNKAKYTYASVGNNPQPGDRVVESTTPFPWTINQYTDGITTHYTIRHTHLALYWTSSGNGSAITLRPGGTDDKQKWGLKTSTTSTQ